MAKPPTWKTNLLWFYWYQSVLHKRRKKYLFLARVFKVSSISTSPIYRKHRRLSIWRVSWDLSESMKDSLLDPPPLLIFGQNPIMRPSQYPPHQEESLAYHYIYKATQCWLILQFISGILSITVSLLLNYRCFFRLLPVCLSDESC